MADVIVTENANLTTKASPVSADRLLLINSETNPNSLNDVELSAIESLILGQVPDTGKGRVVFHTSHSPNTLGAGVNSLAGGSTPTEQYLHYVFPNSADSYREWLCSLQGYNGGGLTFKFLVLRSSAGAGETYIFDLAIRRINSGSEELGASHSYAYNSVTVTIPAGPPAATIPMLATITFTDGADMDSLADGEFFVLRLRRDVDDTATDSCLVLAGMIGIET